MYSILASVIEVSKDGQVVKVVKSFPIEIVPFVFVLAIVAIVFFVALYKKRLEHLQIMAAIEKGTPLSELRPVKQQNLTSVWTRNLTVGIALFIISFGLAGILFVQHMGGIDLAGNTPRVAKFLGMVFVAIILFAFGIGCLIRGLLLRKVDKQSSETDSNQSP